MAGKAKKYSIDATQWTKVSKGSGICTISLVRQVGQLFVAIAETQPLIDSEDYELFEARSIRNRIDGIPRGNYVWLRSSERGSAMVSARDHTGIAQTDLPDGTAATQIGTTQKKWADDFGGVALDSDMWEVETNTGGMTYSVANSNLVVNMGTTINAELRFLSKEVFTIPFDVSVSFMMSQRIANNNVFFEAVEVDPDTLLPIANVNLAGDWANRAAMNFDGTSATTAKLDTIGDSAGALLSTSATITTTASLVDALMELRPQDIVVTSVPSNSSSARGTAAHRNSTNIADPNRIYKIRMRFKNGGTAPASNTVVTVARVLVMDVQEIAVEIASGRGDQVAGKGIAVNIASQMASLNVVGSGATSTSTGGLNSVNRLASAAATVNNTLVKNTAGRIYKIRGYNAAATVKYLKLYNKATAPVAGTDTPVATIALPATKEYDIYFGMLGLYFATGMGFAITGAAADNDTTALVAADVVGQNIWYS